jgi:hypothetical protein
MREDVKDLLHRAADWYRPTPIEPEELARRVARNRRRGRVAAAAVGLAVFAAAGAVTWTAFRPSRGVGPGDTKPRPGVSATVHGVHLTYPGSWTLVDLWPLAGSIASWPEPSGSAIDIPEGTPERGGLPILQLSNDDLGLKSVYPTGSSGRGSRFVRSSERRSLPGEREWVADLVPRADGRGRTLWSRLVCVQGGEQSSNQRAVPRVRPLWPEGNAH